MSEAKATLLQAIAAVMGEVGSVEKRGKNDFHRYNYATASDVFFELQPLLAKHGLIVFQDEHARDIISNGSAMAVTYEFTLAHSTGEVWPFKLRYTGVAAALTSKGSFDDKCVNKCHTAARKYFMLALFQIPTGDYPDADADGDMTQNKAEIERIKGEIIESFKLAETEADLMDWTKDEKAQELFNGLPQPDQLQIRRAWSARRKAMKEAE